MLTNLTDLKWENRIILVNTVNNKDSILNTFEQNETEINERDIVWFVMYNNAVTTNFNGYLTDNFVSNTIEKYKLKDTNDQQKVILLGKDGSIKSNHKSLLLEAIFSQIDAMPMRQIEMQSK